MAQRSKSSGHRAMRLTFTYAGKKLELKETQLLEKRVRASDPILKDDEANRYQGDWIELRDAKDRPLYRRVLHDPFGHSVEAPSDTKDVSFTRRTIDNPRGSFFVVLSAPDAAKSIVLFSSSWQPVKGRGGAREVARFALGKDYKPKKPPKKRPRSKK